MAIKECFARMYFTAENKIKWIFLNRLKGSDEKSFKTSTPVACTIKIF
jgi:hypothetical protein